MDEAQDIVTKLKYGALPVRLLEQHGLSPSETMGACPRNFVLGVEQRHDVTAHRRAPRSARRVSTLDHRDGARTLARRAASHSQTWRGQETRADEARDRGRRDARAAKVGGHVVDSARSRFGSSAVLSDELTALSTRSDQAYLPSREGADHDRLLGRARLVVVATRARVPATTRVQSYCPSRAIAVHVGRVPGRCTNLVNVGPAPGARSRSSARPGPRSAAGLRARIDGLITWRWKVDHKARTVAGHRQLRYKRFM